MRSFTSLLGFALLCGFMYPAPAQADQGEVIETFYCQSEMGDHIECAFRSQGDVTVHVRRQVGNNRCVFNENWGTYDGGVWVDYGCGAEFEVRRPPANLSYRPTGGTLKTVKCKSEQQRHNICRIDNIDAASVSIERQMGKSQGCQRGRSWGVSEGETSPPGIWVDKGCKAIFAYRTHGESFTPYAGTPHDFELPCESIRGNWNHCDVRDVHLARVKLIAGNDACNEYKAWGVDDTGIYVRNNCQGAFRISYRH
ncbi:MAG: DUF3011 domain-containing protein [Xanthomonadales bacterium]|jgi:hypothetical protein|nr:DUF3011 domain-containing protein [Xanthomonadales bacterium]